jgi:hypothetical protein
MICQVTIQRETLVEVRKQLVTRERVKERAMLPNQGDKLQFYNNKLLPNH